MKYLRLDCSFPRLWPPNKDKISNLILHCTLDRSSGALTIHQCVGQEHALHLHVAKDCVLSICTMDMKRGVLNPDRLNIFVRIGYLIKTSLEVLHGRLLLSLVLSNCRWRLYYEE